jgi:phosphinothricin acetyltransferase
MSGPGAPPHDRPRVRDATAADLGAVQAIYAHHVAQGLASFELEPPDRAAMTARFEETRRLGMPYIVAELAGEVRGFAQAGPYRTRPAYRFAVENTVYVAPGFERRGLGRLLLGALIERCAALGYRRMVAVIGDSANRPSIRLHEELGFVRAGLIPSVGFKFGRWVDSVLLQRPLGEGDATLPEETGAP